MGEFCEIFNLKNPGKDSILRTQAKHYWFCLYNITQFYTEIIFKNVPFSAAHPVSFGSEVTNLWSH